jgi:hypothetical protein
MKIKTFVQHGGNEISLEELEKKIKNIWREQGKLQKDLDIIEIYLKMEENKCYYVINGSISDSFDIL